MLSKPSVEKIQAPTQRPSSNIIWRISVILLCVSIILFVHAYHTAYPLTLTETSGFLQQTPISFWLAMIIGILALSLLGSTTNSIIVAGISASIYFILLNSRQILYYGITMGDNQTITGWNIILNQADELPALGSPDYFSYLQWPYHHIITIYIQEIAVTGPIETSIFGYIIYALVFLVSILLFIHSHSTINTPYSIFAGFALLMVLFHYVLNNQFVPQFLALVILVFLFSIHKKSGRIWFAVKIILFVSIVMTHGFFFIFYIFAVALEPSIKALNTVVQKETDDTVQVYQVPINLVRAPRSTLELFFSRAHLEYTKTNWVVFIASLGVTYFIFYLYRFVSFQETAIITVMKFDVTEQGGRTPFDVVWDILPGFVRDAVDFIPTRRLQEPEGPQTQLLYDIASAELHSFTRNGAIIIVLSVFSLLLLSILLEKRSRVSEFGLAILFGASAYFVLGAFTNLLAGRALQVVFLPLVVAIGVFRKSSVVKVVILLLLLSSPIIIANGMVNQSISAGGGDDHLSTVAGGSLEDYSDGDLIRPHGNSLPQDSIRFGEVLSGTQEWSTGDIVIYAPIVDLYIQHRGYDCNLHEENHNVIYDNSAKGLWIDKDQNEVVCSY